jgi:hypothetical protein
VAVLFFPLGFFIAAAFPSAGLALPRRQAKGEVERDLCFMGLGGSGSGCIPGTR